MATSSPLCQRPNSTGPAGHRSRKQGPSFGIARSIRIQVSPCVTLCALVIGSESQSREQTLELRDPTLTDDLVPIPLVDHLRAAENGLLFGFPAMFEDKTHQLAEMLEARFGPTVARAEVHIGVPRHRCEFIVEQTADSFV